MRYGAGACPSLSHLAAGGDAASEHAAEGVEAALVGGGNHLGHVPVLRWQGGARGQMRRTTRRSGRQGMSGAGSCLTGTATAEPACGHSKLCPACPPLPPAGRSCHSHHQRAVSIAVADGGGVHIVQGACKRGGGRGECGSTVRWWAGGAQGMDDARDRTTAGKTAEQAQQAQRTAGLTLVQHIHTVLLGARGAGQVPASKASATGQRGSCSCRLSGARGRGWCSSQQDLTSTISPARGAGHTSRHVGAPDHHLQQRVGGGQPRLHHALHQRLAQQLLVLGLQLLQHLLERRTGSTQGAYK